MRKIQILLVEDNEGDILLTTEALEALTVQNEIKVVKPGKMRWSTWLSPEDFRKYSFLT